MRKVKFIGCTKAQINWGSSDNPDGLLKTGGVYEVEKEEVHGWHTKYLLAGFPGKKFNSVCFQPRT